MLKAQVAHSALREMIRDEIRHSGPLRFSRFMQLALYHPQHGYYSTGQASIGRHGDYFTNVSVGSVFGRLLAAQFIEIWQRMGAPDDFTIVEQGAHDGQFACDVLSVICERAPELFAAIRYRILEPFPILQERQRQRLEEQAFRDKVSWSNSLAELDAFTGIHFSNELLDAMPVDLRGKSVGFKHSQFFLVETEQSVPPNQPQREWVAQLSGKLRRGFVIVFDYGFCGSEFREIVQARAQHRLLDSPFERIGQADISVHLNWSDIARHAEQRNLRVAGFTDQHHFLTGIISTWPDLLPNAISNSTELSGPVSTGAGAKEKRELQTLLHPEMLGRAFQVLLLHKDVNLSEPLAGFRFARDPRQALELR